MQTAEFVRETQVRRQEEPELGGLPGPLAVLRKIIPFEAAAASDRLGWVGIQAARYHSAPASELNPPASPTIGSSFLLGRQRNWIFCMKE